jgi:DNA mismatch repair protein MutL
VNILARSEQEERGNHVATEDGKVVRRKSEGRSIGTTVTVRNLFRKVPARLKFLKSTTTENSHIANTVSQYALGFPEIRFTLVIDGRATLRTAGNNRLLDTIAQIHGSGVAQHMLEVRSGEEEWKSDGNEISVTGMISSPSISRSNRNHLSFFVNRRWISSRLLSWAVEQAYHGLLMTGRHPMAVINISTAPTEVDVNIHPTKTEVKFRNDHQIFVSVQKSVRRSLIEQAPTPEMKDSTKSYTSSLASRQPAWTMPEKNETPIFNVPEAAQVTQHAPLLLRVFGQLASSYIVAEGPDGLYLIDQHAAHERIIYGQLKKRHSKIEVQGLLEPATFEVDPKKEEILRSHYQELKELGFLIEPFGERTYLLRALPVFLMDKDWPTMLRECNHIYSLSWCGKSRADFNR